MSTTMTTDLGEEALRTARILRGTTAGKVIIHSDREAQFTSEQMYQCCKKLNLDQSRGPTGVYWDNAMIESPWSMLTAEFYDRHEWAGPEQAIRGIQQWVYGFHNTKRLNSAIDYQTPTEFEDQQATALATTARPSPNHPKLTGNPHLTTQACNSD